VVLLTVPLLNGVHVHRGARLVHDAVAVLELDVRAVAPDTANKAKVLTFKLFHLFEVLPRYEVFTNV
jgi:hypothetical protein